MGEKRNAYRSLVGKKGKISLEELGIVGPANQGGCIILHVGNLAD
jgi:hypothetical protein